MSIREPWIRRMGFLRDQEGIMNRYLREKGNWDPHLNHSKEFILRCFRDDRIQTVAVLGSGWLLDVPLDEMAKRFSTIYLVDIRHPPQIRKKVEPMSRVRLIEADLTGGADAAAGIRGAHGRGYSRRPSDWPGQSLYRRRTVGADRILSQRWRLIGCALPDRTPAAWRYKLVTLS